MIRCSEERPPARPRTLISILGLLPVSHFTGHGNLTAGVLPAIHIALQHLRRHSWILKNYELQVTLKDTQVNSNALVKNILDVCCFETL